MNTVTEEEPRNTIAFCKGVLLSYAEWNRPGRPSRARMLADALPGEAEAITLGSSPEGPTLDGEVIGNPEAYVRELLQAGDRESRSMIGVLNKAV